MRFLVERHDILQGHSSTLPKSLIKTKHAIPKRGEKNHLTWFHKLLQCKTAYTHSASYV